MNARSKGVQRGRRAEQRGQERRGDRQVQRGDRACPSAPSATPTSARATRGKKNTTRRRPPTRRRSRSSRTSPRRTTAWPTSTTRRRSSTRRPRRARRRMELARAQCGRRRWRRSQRRPVFNQGVILWNAGKIPEAKEQFEQAVKLDPNMADAHYWLGMALVNAGKMPEAAKRTSRPTSSSRRPASTPNGEGHRRIHQEVKKSRRFTVTPSSIAANLAAVRQRIAAAAAPRRTRPDDVQLLAVSKTFGADARPGRLRRRPARLRRKQGPGSPAEDRRNGRIRDQVAPHRPPAVEQGEEGGRPLSRPFTRLTRSICCDAWTRRRRTNGGAPGRADPGRPRRRGDQVRRAGEADAGIARAALECGRRAGRADAAAAVVRRPGTGAPVVPAAARAARRAGRRRHAAGCAARAVDGHEPRLRSGDPGRGHARPRRHRDFRQTDVRT